MPASPLHTIARCCHEGPPTHHLLPLLSLVTLVCIGMRGLHTRAVAAASRMYHTWLSPRHVWSRPPHLRLRSRITLYNTRSLEAGPTRQHFAKSWPCLSAPAACYAPPPPRSCALPLHLLPPRILRFPHLPRCPKCCENTSKSAHILLLHVQVSTSSIPSACTYLPQRNFSSPSSDPPSA